MSHLNRMIDASTLMHAPLPPGDGARHGMSEQAVQSNASAIELDRRLLDDNVAAAIHAAERIHMLAKKKLREQGLAPPASHTNGRRGVVATDLSDGIVKALSAGLMNFLKPVLADLEKRLVAIEARPTMKYEGVWDAEKVYSVGDFVTDDGSLWHCSDSNVGVRPGSSDAWQLAVKRGRDGKVR